MKKKNCDCIVEKQLSKEKAKQMFKEVALVQVDSMMSNSNFKKLIDNLGKLGKKQPNMNDIQRYEVPQEIVGEVNDMSVYKNMEVITVEDYNTKLDEILSKFHDKFKLDVNTSFRRGISYALAEIEQYLKIKVVE